MPQKLVWTAPSDARLKRLRAEGHSWDRIAAELAISRNAAIERGRRLGARLPPPEHVPEPEDPDRPPMPAGHFVSWGAITAGTCLAGAPYTYQGMKPCRDLPAPGRGEIARIDVDALENIS